MHTSPALFSGKFIPPFSMLLIGLIALLVKCWDLLLQRFETAPCNVYLPDMAEIICFHDTRSTSAFQQLAGLVRSVVALGGTDRVRLQSGWPRGERSRPRRRWMSHTCWNNHIYSLTAYLDLAMWWHVPPCMPARVGHPHCTAWTNCAKGNTAELQLCPPVGCGTSLGKSCQATPGLPMGAEPAPMNLHPTRALCRRVPVKGVLRGPCRGGDTRVVSDPEWRT